eukprot:6409274-Prymnesium_polylepis.1
MRSTASAEISLMSTLSHEDRSWCSNDTTDATFIGCTSPIRCARARATLSPASSSEWAAVVKMPCFLMIKQPRAMAELPSAGISRELNGSNAKYCRAFSICWSIQPRSVLALKLLIWWNSCHRIEDVKRRGLEPGRLQQIVRTVVGGEPAAPVDEPLSTWSFDRGQHAHEWLQQDVENDSYGHKDEEAEGAKDSSIALVHALADHVKEFAVPQAQQSPMDGGLRQQ